nr:siderophore-interacting protein [Parvibaculum indicum]
MPYRLFEVRLLRKTVLSPHLCRLTFTGDDIDMMCTGAPDQRIKVFFPGADGKPPSLPLDDSWLGAYQAMPTGERPPRRTYTIRALRPGEMDIDFVLHGETGPASRWALHADPGARIQLAAPNRAYDGDTGGYEWRPPTGAKRVLIIADETALPAVTGILEDLAALDVRPLAEVYLEMPSTDDCVGLPDFPELNLEWLPRKPGDRHGAQMLSAAARAHVPSDPAPDRADALPDIDVDTDILWDRATTDRKDFYVWVAGEAHAVKEIRRILLKERGVDRKSANLMGYWRAGRVMD